VGDGTEVGCNAVLNPGTLLGPRSLVGDGRGPALGALVLVVGSMTWAVGTLMTRTTGAIRSPMVFSSVQMLSAGVSLGALALAAGEIGAFSVADVSLKSGLSWLYLVLAGSIVAYSAYVYLLGVVSAAKAATYAYVNPVIAVLLGWAFANEPIGARTLVAAAVILAGVAIITSTQTSGSSVTGEHPVPEPRTRDRAA